LEKKLRIAAWQKYHETNSISLPALNGIVNLFVKALEQYNIVIEHPQNQVK
jgi:hypothetical protein